MKTRRRKKTETASIRYRPMLARGECAACGHWAILADGVCSGCRNGASVGACMQTLADEGARG